jgi:hypothetical protein
MTALPWPSARSVTAQQPAFNATSASTLAQIRQHVWSIHAMILIAKHVLQALQTPAIVVSQATT